MKVLLSMVVVVVSLSSVAPSASAQDADKTAINLVLNSYHQAAATADWDSYFSLMSEDGVFLGTDASERWTKQEFQRYAAGSSGWVYTPGVRNINLTPDGLSAWFDESLRSQNYGTSRGTGVLIRTAAGWKISQYHLTFPIPNDLSGQITDQIKQFEAQQ